jgi:hypothetical protein
MGKLYSSFIISENNNSKLLLFGSYLNLDEITIKSIKVMKKMMEKQNIKESSISVEEFEEVYSKESGIGYTESKVVYNITIKL